MNNRNDNRSINRPLSDSIYGGSQSTTITPYYSNKVKDDIYKTDKLYDNTFVQPQITRYDEKPIVNDPHNLRKYKPITEVKQDLSQIEPTSVKTIVHVDSSQRNKNPKNVYTNLIQLQPYPIQFTANSKNIIITQQNHTYKTDDLITITNVVGKNVNLKNPIIVKKNSKYLRIKHPNHGLTLMGTYDDQSSELFQPVEYVGDLPLSYNRNDNVPDGINQNYILISNNTQNFFINISGVKGVDNNNNFIGNIPVNYINKQQRVFLIFTKVGVKFISDPNSYMIELLRPSSTNYQDGTDGTNLVNIEYDMLYGIPLNYINASFPITSYNLLGYQTIVSTTINTYTITLQYPALIDPNYPYYNFNDTYDINFNQNVINNNLGGGSNICVRNVGISELGFPNPNNYTITLDDTYRNVTEIKLISTEFPNSIRVINPSNNRLYWQNLDDGSPIYYLTITSGNYKVNELENAIMNAFADTLRYPYSQEFLTNKYDDSLILSLTPINPDKYDALGYSKYNIVKVDINHNTDVVTFNFYRQLIQTNNLTVPDGGIILTQNGDIKTVYGNIQYPLLNTDDLYVYYTNNTASVITNFPFAYGYLFKLTEFNSPTEYTCVFDDKTSIMFNFYNGISNIILSLNNTTLLTSFSYNFTLEQVIISNHNLKVGDLIVTDQFNDPMNPNVLRVFEVSQVITSDIVNLTRYNAGDGPKFIYDDLMINFGNFSNPLLNYFTTSPTNSIIGVSVLPTENTMIIYHPNHNLNVGDEITISNSTSINRIPSEFINQTFIIDKIIDNDHYSVNIEIFKYLSVPVLDTSLNTVLIQYPDLARMFFNYPDTLGNILSFFNVGEPDSITSFRSIIKNTDAYEINVSLANLGNEYIQPLKKLSITGPNYFFIVSRDLAVYTNANSIQYVFAKIQLTDEPGAVLFNTFVPVTKVFQVPLDSLTEMKFEFRFPDGSLVDFNGLDHSMTFEITELYNDPPDVNIIGRTDAKINIV